MSLTPDAVIDSIGEFTYNPKEGLTFTSYFLIYEKIF